MCSNRNNNMALEQVAKPHKKLKTCQEGNIESMQQCSSTDMVQPVLADEYTRDVVLEKAIIVEIRDKKLISHVVRLLNEKYPVTSWLHLKRVKCDKESDKADRVYVLVSPLMSGGSAEDKCAAVMEDLASRDALSDQWMGASRVVDVPKYAAHTRHQYTHFSQYWPMSFHEDKHISKLIKGEYLSEFELTSADHFMKMAIETAKKSNNPAPEIGCVIVNPKSQQVLAVSHDLRSGHVLDHATMVAIDLVAKGQGGGSHNFDSSDVSWHNDDNQSSDGSLPYLCTSYDLYTTHEPCTMCGMALVHSRIRRVFYCLPTEYGVLGTTCNLHVQKGINHHFEVFKWCGPKSVELCRKLSTAR